MLLVLHNMLELTVIAKMNKNIILLLYIMSVGHTPTVGEIGYIQQSNKVYAHPDGIGVAQNINTQLNIIYLTPGTWVIQASVEWYNFSYGPICSAISSSNTINSDPHCATTTFANTENVNNLMYDPITWAIQGSYQTLQRVVQVVNNQTFYLIAYSYSCDTSVITSTMSAIMIA